MNGVFARLAALLGDPPVRRLAARTLARGALADSLSMLRTLSSPADRRSEKVVSRKHGFVCICVPKAGSRSLITALLNAVADAEVFCLNTEELFAVRPEAKAYFSFALVRHPFARSLSLYQELFVSERVYDADYPNHRRQTGTRAIDPVAGMPFHMRAPAAHLAAPAHKTDKRRRMARRCHGLREVRSFDDFCDWLGTPFGSDRHADRHFLSQHAHIRMADDRLPDVVGHLEHWESDLAAVAERVGMPMPNLPTLNTMAGWHVAPAKLADAQAVAEALLTERNKKLLRRRYAADLALGGYQA